MPSKKDILKAILQVTRISEDKIKAFPEEAILEIILGIILIIMGEDNIITIIMVIMDMEAGLEHLGRGTAANMDQFVVVIEPGARSVQTYKNVKRLASDLGVNRVRVVANKIRDSKDEDFIRQQIPAEDLLGFVHMIPERARERILDIAATQFPDGSAYHQYQPLTKKGNLTVGSGFNDDPLWLIAAVDAYLRETGDFAVLDEIVPFDNDESLAQPLMEHLRRSFNYTLTHLGPHGLPLIGRADWNDCLNLNCFSAHPGESFQTTGPSEGPVAESVFIAGMFCKYGPIWADLCRRRGLTDEAKTAETAIAAMEQAVLKDGWDGAWFLRAYDAFGKKVGSKECDEGQIFIEPQGMCVMAGIGKDSGQAQQAMDSVRDRLETKYGVVVHQPAYTTYRLNLGEISSYPPGYKENAAVFCHNNPWITVAETVLGNGERAWELYKKICPAYLEDISDIHRTEPYVYSQMIAGRDAPTFGEAKNSWLTGTAAWTLLSITQAILGITPTMDGLSVVPVLPAELKEYDVVRRYRGAAYHIHVENKGGKAVRLTVDGKAINGTVLHVAPAGAEVTVTATLE